MEATIPAGFNLLDIPLPPMLLQMAGVSVESRFISLYYYGSKATWSDGRSCATFSYFHCYEPLIHHFAVAIHLYPYHLGSDDEYPTHALVCDRVEEKLYVGSREEVEQFLEAQHPPRQPITSEAWEAIRAELALKQQPDIAQMQRLGMFELFGPPNPSMQQEAIELIHWLDQHIDEALVLKYLKAAKAGNHQAIFAIEGFKRRCGAGGGES